MPFLDRIPKLDKCCGCVTDLKTAAAIIVVLSIVTSPLISWAVIRHAYVIRISCVVTTNSTQPDVVDINFNNALSFGFGANAGLGSSCLSHHTNNTTEDKRNSTFVRVSRQSGWVVLLADVAFLISSVNFLVKMFKGRDKEASFIFIICGLISIILSFIYGILYISACVYVGSGFPVFEFSFAVVDFILCVIRLYFIVVINSYYHLSPPTVSASERFFKFMTFTIQTLYGYFINLSAACFGGHPEKKEKKKGRTKNGNQQWNEFK